MANEHGARPTESAHHLGGVRFPPPALYLLGLLAGIVLEIVVGSGDLPFPFAVIAAVIGVSMFTVLSGGALSLFTRSGTSPIPATPATALVTTGPYRYTRNPMYLGLAFLYAGIALVFGLLWALAALPVVLLIVDRVVIPPEERHLEARFGDEYRAYKTRVRRWI